MEMERLRLEKLKKKPNRNKNVIMPMLPKEGEMKSEMTQEKQSVVKFPGKKYILRSVNNPYTGKNLMYNTFINDLVEDDKKDEKQRAVK